MIAGPDRIAAVTANCGRSVVRSTAAVHRRLSANCVSHGRAAGEPARAIASTPVKRPPHGDPRLLRPARRPGRVNP